MIILNVSFTGIRPVLLDYNNVAIGQILKRYTQTLTLYTLTAEYQQVTSTVKLTDFDFLGIKLVDFPLQTLQPPLNPAGPPEHHPCLHLDAQEDVAGMSIKVGKLVDYVG